MIQYELGIEVDGARVAGSLLLPSGGGRFPCVIIAGGTMSHDRDGALIGHPLPVPQRDALRRMAIKLGEAGYAVIRWDKRGYGRSGPCPPTSSYTYEVEDLVAFLDFARRHPAISRVVIAGESAGAYVACLAARRGHSADAYVFLGALYADVEGLLRYNYVRLAEYTERSTANRRWAEENAPLSLAIGENFDGIIDAAGQGREYYPLKVNGREWRFQLGKLREEMEFPPHQAFHFIAGPSLVLQGDADMNVCPADAMRIEAALKGAGNNEVERVMIPGADHSFQVAPEDEDTRIRERHSLASFLRPYKDEFYEAMLEWLEKTMTRV